MHNPRILLSDTSHTLMILIIFVVVVYGKLRVVRSGLLEFGNKIVSSSFSSELAWQITANKLYITCIFKENSIKNFNSNGYFTESET
jgi:hypothetical protein